MKRTIVVLCVALLVLSSTTALAGRRGSDARFEISIGHNVYPRQPRIASVQLSVRVAETNGIQVFTDVGYGVGSERKDHPKVDGFLVGISGGNRKQRFRYGVHYHVPSEEVFIGVRLRMLSF